MKTYLLFLFFFLLYFNNDMNAQLKKGSKISKEIIAELNMNAYPEDPSASAVILSKKGITRFLFDKVSGFQYQYTLNIRLKILKPEGLDHVRHSISYYMGDESEWEKITEIKGTIYNMENGEATETILTDKDITEENSGGKWKNTTITMPAVKVGSVIEIEYTLASSFYQELPEFSFQSTIPVKFVSYNIIIPSYLTYNFMIHGRVKVKRIREPARGKFDVSFKDENGKIKTKRYECIAEEKTFVVENVPALKNEPYLWSLNDHFSRISFELKKINFPWDTPKNYDASWEEADKKLLVSTDFGNNLKRQDLFKDNIQKGDLSLQNASRIQKMIYEKVKWNGTNSLYPSGLDVALKQGSGNSADLNFLLINALISAGFEVYPVVLRTREKGNMPVINPSVRSYDYSITAIKTDSCYYYADASSKYGTWNVLPEKCLVPQARIVKPESDEWVNLSAVFPGKEFFDVEMRLEGQNIKENISVLYRGCCAYDFDMDYTRFKDEKEFIKDLGNKYGGRIDSFSITRNGKYGEDILVKYVLTKKIEQKENRIYLNPLVKSIYPDNPFKNENRNFPVNFDNFENHTQTIHIHIPPGYEVEKLPESIIHTFGERELEYSCQIEVGKENVTMHYNLRINNLYIPENEYSGVKELFSKIALKNAEQIVFRKIAE